MLKVEIAPIIIPLLLVTTAAVADVANELARCQLEAERLFPAPHNMGLRNGQNGQLICKNGPRTSKRACGRPVIASLQSVLFPSGPTKAA
jgi:hypothetical protein